MDRESMEKNEKDNPQSFDPWLTFAKVVHAVGNIGELLMVNAHKFNHIPPKEMQEKVQKAKDDLDWFVHEYAKHYKDEGPRAH